MSLVCSQGVWFGREKSPGIGTKGHAMSIHDLSSEHWDPTTICAYPGTRLLVSDDHLTPTCGPRFYTLLTVHQMHLISQ